MKFYPEIVYQIVQQIDTSTTGKHGIIIGENSSGKSEVVRQLVQKRLSERTPVYFLDSVNRIIDVQEIMKEKKDLLYNPAIVSNRIKPEFFNIQDTFSCYGTQTERIGEIYSFYEQKLQEYLKEFLGITFRVCDTDGLREVCFEDGMGKLSSGYQALTRIFLELLYYQHTVVDKVEFKEFVVIIDEIDENLAPDNAGRILPFLISHFPHMRFVVTTHSIDLVVSAKNADIIIVSSDGGEFLDSEDFTTISEVSMMFERVFGVYQAEKADDTKQKIDKTLRRLLNNKLSGIWSSMDEEKFRALGEEKLSNSQKFLYKQIQEWG